MIRKGMTVRKFKLGEEPVDISALGLSPEERVIRVWEVTKRAYAFAGKPVQSRLPRHVVRVSRRGG